MDTILKIENVKKYFGKKEILKGISLSVQEGEIISVLGPSGCGKSTLLNLIAGILPLDEGSISIRGRVVSNAARCEAPEKRNINMVFQDFALWPHMKARDNILYGLNVKKIPRKEQLEKLEKVVSMLHLEGLLEQYPAELSGGQQQRVAIARALITRPAIILLDEPLCNLDIQLRVEMRTEMSQLFHSLNTTVFHVTHDPSEAFAMADRIVVMDQGIIDQDDTPELCYKKPATAMVAGLLGAGNAVTGAEVLSDDGEYCTVRVGDALLTGLGFSVTDKTAAGAVESGKVYAVASAAGGVSGHGEGIKGSSRSYSQTSPKPEKCELRFRAEECGYRDAMEDNTIPITVILSTFEGGVYRIKVKTCGGEELCLLHDGFLPSGLRGFLKVDREKLYIYH